MSSSMQRIVSRPFTGRSSAPAEAPSQPAPAAPDVQGSATDYMLRDDERLQDQWVNPHVAAYHSQRARPAALQRQNTSVQPLRTMTPEQRAAYVAQRDAENAAAAGSDAHPVVRSPREAPAPPTPTVPAQYRTLAPPGQGVNRARPAASDVPETPQVSSDPDASDAPRGQPTSSNGDVFHLEQPLDRLPTPPPVTPTTQAVPQPTSPPPAPARQSASSSLQEALQSPLHFVPPRRRSSLQVRADVEVEVRGAGADRVVTIRFLSPNAASGATATR